MFDWLFGNGWFPDWERGYDEYENSPSQTRTFPDGSVEGCTDWGSHYVEKKYFGGQVWREYDDGRVVKISG